MNAVSSRFELLEVDAQRRRPRVRLARDGVALRPCRRDANAPGGRAVRGRGVEIRVDRRVGACERGRIAGGDRLPHLRKVPVEEVGEVEQDEARSLLALRRERSRQQLHRVELLHDLLVELVEAGIGARLCAVSGLRCHGRDAGVAERLAARRRDEPDEELARARLVRVCAPGRGAGSTRRRRPRRRAVSSQPALALRRRRVVDPRELGRSVDARARRSRHGRLRGCTSRSGRPGRRQTSVAATR